MDYIGGNKAAWEEAFENRKPNWGEDNHLRLKSERFAFFDDDMRKELERLALAGKTVAQFCCNNGRELLSLMDSGASTGIGFDIAENIIAQARETAEKAGIKNCEFVACNILEIPENYRYRFDFVLLTVGAICWFEDLRPLFEKAAKCLKPGGLLLVNDFHPVTNMLPMPWEDCYNPDDLSRVAHSYFRKEPWTESDGVGYMSVEYVSKTFTSFSHTMSDIVNALSANGMKTVRLNEYDYDIGLADVYDGKGFPLSFVLIAENLLRKTVPQEKGSRGM